MLAAGFSPEVDVLLEARVTCVLDAENTKAHEDCWIRMRPRAR